jgi:hypothetical protein
VENNLPDERKLIGRVWFARAPDSDIWVSFDDLPEAVVTALTQGVERHEEIVGLAALQLKIDLASQEGKACPSEMNIFKERLYRLDIIEIAMLFAATKLLQRKQYAVTSDNPQTISRCRALAKHMGAFVDEIRKGKGITQIILSPGPRQ